jgi:hypothetical protein
MFLARGQAKEIFELVDAYDSIGFAPNRTDLMKRIVC